MAQIFESFKVVVIVVIQLSGLRLVSGRSYRPLVPTRWFHLVKWILIICWLCMSRYIAKGPLESEKWYEPAIIETFRGISS